MEWEGKERRGAHLDILSRGPRVPSYTTASEAMLWRVTAVDFLPQFLLTDIYLRQVNEVNGGDNAFVRCVCVCLSVCLFVCAQWPVMGVKCQ